MAKSYPISEVRGGGREELPRVPGQLRPGGDTPRLRSGTTRRSHLAPEARAGDPEEPPHIQGVVAAWAQEGLEEPSHVEGQEGQR